jgi:hypothetical protein
MIFLNTLVFTSHLRHLLAHFHVHNCVLMLRETTQLATSDLYIQSVRCIANLFSGNLKLPGYLERHSARKLAINQRSLDFIFNCCVQRVTSYIKVSATLSPSAPSIYPVPGTGGLKHTNRCRKVASPYRSIRRTRGILLSSRWRRSPPPHHSSDTCRVPPVGF